MVIVFVFDDEENQRATAMGVNTIKLPEATDEQVEEFIDSPMTKMFMPFLQNAEERKKLMDDFHNQHVMREIWSGKRPGVER